MLIGLRLLLLVAGLAVAVAFLGFLFTKNPRFLQLSKNIIKVTLLFAALIAIIYILERVLLA
ncbi:MAG TPA: hypothetical protein VF928_07165 [Usitatibacteraceae bacterium]